MTFTKLESDKFAPKKATFEQMCQFDYQTTKITFHNMKPFKRRKKE